MKHCTMFFLVAGAVITLMLPPLLQAEMYKWVDKNGVIHFDEHPPNEDPSKAERLDKDDPARGRFQRIQTPDVPPDREEDSLKEGGYAPSKGSSVKVIEPRKNKVELFVTSWCPYCKKAVDFFQDKGVPFTIYDIEKDKAAKRRYEDLAPRAGVPFVLINGQGIVGYSEAAYERALKQP